MASGKHKDFITSIVEEKYSVKKILKVEIEKSDGGTRTLEIPTVIDHISTAMHVPNIESIVR